MRWIRRADDTRQQVHEERKDDERLREAVAIRQHDLERRLRLAAAQGKALGKGAG